MAKWQVLLGLAGWITVSLLAGAIGSLATASSVSTWYASELQKPDWTPPGWVFGPVWTILYVMMGTAAWLVWRRHGFRGAALPLSLFLAQLVLNAAWSLVFFGLRAPGAALVELVVLWLAIAATGAAFSRRDKWAALLLIPYLAWTSFAAALNFAIWRMNA